MTKSLPPIKAASLSKGRAPRAQDEGEARWRTQKRRGQRKRTWSESRRKRQAVYLGNEKTLEIEQERRIKRLPWEEEQQKPRPQQPNSSVRERERLQPSTVGRKTQGRLEEKERETGSDSADNECRSFLCGVQCASGECLLPPWACHLPRKRPAPLPGTRRWLAPLPRSVFRAHGSSTDEFMPRGHPRCAAGR